jgi:hypothetical protein
LRTGIVSRLVKQPGRDVDHLPPSIAEVKNEWSHTLYSPSTPFLWREQGLLYLYFSTQNMKTVFSYEESVHCY